MKIICWFYVKNCTSVHITDKFFSVTGPPSEAPDPHCPLKLEVLEPPMTNINNAVDDGPIFLVQTTVVVKDAMH